MANGAKLVRRRKSRSQPQVRLPRVDLLRYLKPIVFVVAAFGLGSTTVIASQSLVGQFKIERIEVEGDLLHLRPGDVQARLESLLLDREAQGDLTGIKTLLESKPWVAQARVRRVWPSALQIELVEQRPVARWNDHQFLGMNGELFEPVEPPLLALPHIRGLDGQEAETYTQFLAWHEALKALGLELVGVSHERARGWSLTTASGLTLELGRTDLSERLARFSKIWPTRLATQPGLVSVDLRYDNALSVRIQENDRGES